MAHARSANGMGPDSAWRTRYEPGCRRFESCRARQLSAIVGEWNKTFAGYKYLGSHTPSPPGDKMSKNLITIVFLLVPASIVTLASDYVAPHLPETCETGEIVALRSAAFRGPTEPGIADDQFRLAVAIEEAANSAQPAKRTACTELTAGMERRARRTTPRPRIARRSTKLIGTDQRAAWRSSILLLPMAMQRHKRGSRCAISRALVSSEMSLRTTASRSGRTYEAGRLVAGIFTLDHRVGLSVGLGAPYVPTVPPKTVVGSARRCRSGAGGGVDDRQAYG